MSSKTEWHDMGQSIGRDAIKLESAGQSGSPWVILGVWLAFYLLAATHSLLLQPAAAPIATAQAEEIVQTAD